MKALTYFSLIMMMGDFNAGLDNVVLKVFCNLYNLKSLVNKATCYKSPNNPSCIDLVLTKFPKYFRIQVL